MKIEDDEFEQNKNKNSNKRLMTIILVLIVLTMIFATIITVMILSLKGHSLSVVIDGKDMTSIKDAFYFTEDGQDIYVAIRDIAPYVGYEAHNGEYKVNAEDTSKMYVEAKDGSETTSFYLNSTLINKVAPNSTNDYDNVKISKPVIMINNKWYITIEGFRSAFNSSVTYDKSNNVINIQTLPYLVEFYDANVAEYGYDKLSEEFNNQKALVYGMLVASKNSTNKYGVINIKTGEDIISPRYNKIEFLEGQNEFIITNASNKVGIAYANGETKIDVSYDEIKVLDSELGYYLVKSNSKYGVIKSDKEWIIHIEYDKIGIDTSNFANDVIMNQYLLYDSMIPVLQNGKWGLFDAQGNKITGIEYDSIGSNHKDVKDSGLNNAAVVADTGVVIVSKDGKYGGINNRGDMLIPMMFDDVYSEVSDGEVIYYIVYNGVNYLAEDYINLMKEKLGYNEEDEEDMENVVTNPDENQEEDTQNVATDNTIQNEEENLAQEEENLVNDISENVA